MRTLFTLLIGTFIVCNSFGQTITIKRNSTVTWEATNVPKALDTLILETNSTLVLKTNVNLVVGFFKIGENVKINAQGGNGSIGTTYSGSQPRRKHGHGKGSDGKNGGNGSSGSNGFEFKISTGLFEFGSIVINTSGGNGGKGGNAEGGGKGTNASCDGHSGGAGGNGGAGGDGARGGNAATVLIAFNEIKQNDGSQLGVDIKWISNGGTGGSGGSAGSGGSGGNSAKCGLSNQKGGNGGNSGGNGSNGSNGNSINITQAEWLKYN